MPNAELRIGLSSVDLAFIFNFIRRKRQQKSKKKNNNSGQTDRQTDNFDGWASA